MVALALDNNISVGSNVSKLSHGCSGLRAYDTYSYVFSLWIHAVFNISRMPIQSLRKSDVCC